MVGLELTRDGSMPTTHLRRVVLSASHWRRFEEVNRELTHHINEWESNPDPSHEPQLLALCYSYLGDTDFQMGHVERAIGSLKAAALLSMGYPELSAQLQHTIGAYCNDLGQWRESVEFHNAALTAYEETGDVAGQATVCDNWGVALVRCHWADHAATVFHLFGRTRARSVDVLGAQVRFTHRLGTGSARHGGRGLGRFPRRPQLMDVVRLGTIVHPSPHARTHTCARAHHPSHL